MSTRTVITLPPVLRAGEPFEVQVLIAHPMETGHRRDADGRLLPRDIVRRFSCSWNGERIIAVELFPAIAANPYLEFSAWALDSGTLDFVWEGDHGFQHREQRTISVA